MRKLWESCFPYFVQPIETQRKDVEITIGGGMALISFLTRVQGTGSDHPAANSWFRATTVLQKQAGDWKIILDHVSFPVDCMEEKPIYLPDKA